MYTDMISIVVNVKLPKNQAKLNIQILLFTNILRLLHSFLRDKISEKMLNILGTPSKNQCLID